MSGVGAVRMTGPAPGAWTSVLPVYAPALCAGLAFHRVYGLRPVALVAAVAALAAVLPSAVATARASRRGDEIPPLAATFAGAAALTMLSGWLLLYRSSAPTPALAGRVADDVVDAPHRVLTLVPPVPDDGSLLVLPFAAVAIGAYASAELAVRTRAVLAPVVPSVAVFALAVVLGAGGPGADTAVATGFAAACGVLVVARAPGRPSGRARAVALVGVPLVAVQAVVVGAVGPGLSGVDDRTPASLRDTVPLPEAARVTGASPLDLVGAWLRDPARPLFRVEASGAAARSRDVEMVWRLAVFTRYDGVTWYPADRLRPTAGSVPEAPESNVRTLPLDQHVTIQALPGGWLPAADRPVRIVGPAAVPVAVDPASGVLAATTPLHEGDTYRVRSEMPVFEPALVEYAPTTVDPAATELPDAARSDQELLAQAQQATQGASFPYQQALRLARWLRDNHRFDVDVVGHAYHHMQSLLAEKRGTSEQFATAFAVMARSLGLPTRLVVGFRTGVPDGEGALQVSGGDVVVWPEVEFRGIGWVPFQPTPGDRAGAGASESPPGGTVPPSPASQGAAEKRAAEDARIIEEEHEAAPAVPPVRASGEDGGPGWWVWVLAIAALPVVAAAGWWLTRWVRRLLRRRAVRRADPEVQVLAAWQGIVRRLTRSGMAHSTSRTVEEVAEYGRRRLAVAAELPWLADRVNEIAYGGAVTSPEVAAAAWHRHDAIRKALRAERRRGRRR